MKIFNDYVKNPKLNNMVDKDTRVYISSIKLSVLDADSPIKLGGPIQVCPLITKLTYNLNGFLDNMDLRIVYDTTAYGYYDQMRGNTYVPTCRLIIQDEVNIKLEGLEVDVRRKLANAPKFEVPCTLYAQYKLGRWDGKVAFGMEEQDT